MTKATSVKFPKEMLTEIDNECEGLGCNRTDFIRDAVQKKLDGKSQDQEENTPGPDRNPTPTPESKPTLTKIPEKKPQVVFLDDYEIKSEVKELINPKIVIQPKPPTKMAYFGKQLLPFAKRYDK